VNNSSTVAVEGLEEGETVQGVLNLQFRTGDFNDSGSTRGSSWLYIAPPVILLLGVWIAFVLTAPFGAFLAAQPPSRSAVAGQSLMSPAPVNQALWKEGQDVYAKNCAACHQGSGEGIPLSFPPLAGNPNLGDAQLVVDTVYRGRSGAITVNGKSFDGTMPPVGADLSNKDVAAVATYIRNNWGNIFGGVTEKEVSQILSGRSSISNNPPGKSPAWRHKIDIRFR
jgi:cytochrome c oxidase subunit 2